jgi:hypothetical protein
MGDTLDIEQKKRKQFNIYADEFQRFATEDFAVMLTEARKFGIATTIAHQMRGQLDGQNRGATLNVANFVVFRVSGNDAEELARQFDATPPPAELRREEKLQPVRDVVGHLLSVGHADPITDKFVTNILKPFYNEMQRGRTSKKDLLDMLNTLFYQIMVKRNPREIVPTILFYNLIYRYNDNGGNYPKLFPKLFKTLEKSLVNYSSDTPLLGNIPLNVPLRGNVPLYETWHESKEKQALERLWVSPDFDQMKKDPFDIKEFYDFFELLHVQIVAEHKMNSGESDFNTAYNWSFDNILDKELIPFLNFFIMLIGAMNGLAISPITASSGIYENVPGIQRTYADMQNEIASTLVTLPQRTARVKIAEEDGIVEHTIQIMQPERSLLRGIGTSLRQERLKRIQKQNRDDGYCRPRKEVEREIDRRQEQCSGSLGSPALLAPSPEPPGSPRRKKIN